MQVITQMLMNNVNQRMTIELLNGMNHAIKAEFDKVHAQLLAVEAERDELREKLGVEQSIEPAVDPEQQEES
ncbi:hypothetical protein ACLPHM_05810 [Paenalcaligenes sp. Me131]|uniref:hypothetical protein n=1 Tax=Paenalcaligenes sp. Me131 TaxID=3392636 RepID=UPI003D2D6506